MDGDKSDEFLEQRLAVPNPFRSGFVEGMNYALPLDLLDEPLPVMLNDRASHIKGWFTGGAVGFAVDGVLLYTAIQVASQVLDYL